MEKKRHSDLTTNQVREKLFISFMIIIIFLWIILFYGSINTPNAYADRNQNTIEAEGEVLDDNITAERPTNWWRLNSNGYSQRYIHLTWNNKDDRVTQLLQTYGFEWEEWNGIKTIARIHRIQPEMFVCIMYADSSIWRFLKTKHNYGNVWNNDRGDTKAFETFEQWVDAIWRYALNWTYLKDKYTLDYLTPAFWKSWPYYATSPENRHINVTNCLWMIHNKRIDDNWSFRR